MPSTNELKENIAFFIAHNDFEKLKRTCDTLTYASPQDALGYVGLVIADTCNYTKLPDDMSEIEKNLGMLNELNAPEYNDVLQQITNLKYSQCEIAAAKEIEQAKRLYDKTNKKIVNLQMLEQAEKQDKKFAENRRRELKNEAVSVKAIQEQLLKKAEGRIMKSVILKIIGAILVVVAVILQLINYNFLKNVIIDEMVATEGPGLLCIILCILSLLTIVTGFYLLFNSLAEKNRVRKEIATKNIMAADYYINNEFDGSAFVTNYGKSIEEVRAELSNLRNALNEIAAFINTDVSTLKEHIYRTEFAKEIGNPQIEKIRVEIKRMEE